MADKPLTAAPALTTAAGAGVNTGSFPPLLRLVRFPLLSSCLCVDAAVCAAGMTGCAEMTPAAACAVGATGCAETLAAVCAVVGIGCAEKTLAAACAVSACMILSYGGTGGTGGVGIFGITGSTGGTGLPAVPDASGETGVGLAKGLAA